MGTLVKAVAVRRLAVDAPRWAAANAARARRAVRRDGLMSVAKRLTADARARFALDEHHVWYELRLDELGDPPELPEGATLQHWGPAEVELPADVATVEDSLTAASERGHGMAARALAQVASSLRSRGYRSLITKVAAPNTAAHRLVEKVGFRPVAHVRLRRRGPLSRVCVSPPAGLGRDLALALDCRADGSTPD